MVPVLAFVWSSYRLHFGFQKVEFISMSFHSKASINDILHYYYVRRDGQTMFLQRQNCATFNFNSAFVLITKKFCTVHRWGIYNWDHVFSHLKLGLSQKTLLTFCTLIQMLVDICVGITWLHTNNHTIFTVPNMKG